jgi:hypothetical protein
MQIRLAMFNSENTEVLEVAQKECVDHDLRRKGKMQQLAFGH